MSFDLYVVVPAKSWPTARQLDDALIASGYPIRLGKRSAEAWTQPLGPVDAEPIRFLVKDESQAKALGKPVGSEIEIPNTLAMPVMLNDVTLDPDFGMETVLDSDDINAKFADFGCGAIAQNGDWLIWFLHHVDQRNYNAGIYILATLILRFGGHGFDPQGMGHGREDFAEELLASLYANPIENPFD